jgi:hypothetical protein
MLAGSVFTPGSPVSERDLFAGRQDQIKRIMEAVSQKGFHATLSIPPLSRRPLGDHRATRRASSIQPK